MYSIDEIRNIVSPIAEKHGVDKVYIFGSYARKQANIDSDIDICIDKGKIRTLFQLSGFRLDIEDALNIPVDLITTENNDQDFISNIRSDEVLIYG